MFVRLKTPDGKNVTLVASKISDFEEGEAIKHGETEPTKVTMVVMDNGGTRYVVESERKIRSLMTKAFAGNGAAEDGADD